MPVQRSCRIGNAWQQAEGRQRCPDEGGDEIQD